MYLHRPLLTVTRRRHARVPTYHIHLSMEDKCCQCGSSDKLGHEMSDQCDVCEKPMCGYCIIAWETPDGYGAVCEACMTDAEKAFCASCRQSLPKESVGATCDVDDCKHPVCNDCTNGPRCYCCSDVCTQEHGLLANDDRRLLAPLCITGSNE